MNTVKSKPYLSQRISSSERLYKGECKKIKLWKVFIDKSNTVIAFPILCSMSKIFVDIFIFKLFISILSQSLSRAVFFEEPSYVTGQ